MQEPLTPHTLQQGVQELIKRDRSFATIVDRYDLPPFWQRDPGFSTLIHIILEQQVSLASAQATYTRLLASCDPLTPDSFLDLSDVELRQVGFSRQKTNYGRALAQAIQHRRLDLPSLGTLSDQAAQTQLITIKGIGLWTANIYLLMALRRPDIWPKGDLALQIAIQQLKQLPQRPTSDQAQTMSLAWKPWRAVAARLLWHFYLSERRQAYP
ncbi:MAG: DNA-3-methyladenine glycosylase 2 family protein [Symploca sp. SIO2G7]|nr:DNA-3-methyladenine glycosylase 2 family protein [Symploca sp. SIO2G7]